MESSDFDYLGRRKRFRAYSKRIAAAFFVLAIIVATAVFWWLKLVGITVAEDAFCGLDEHTHGEECYTAELVCGFEDAASADLAADKTSAQTESVTEQTSAQTESVTEQTSAQTESVTEQTSAQTETETEQTHTHTEACYRRVLVCTLPEHTHTAACFPDRSADTETEEDWLKTLEGVELTNDVAENLVAVASAQVGYRESERNLEFDAEGNKNGYTRYGEWYGNPYGKWSAMFVSFCLQHSNINASEELTSSGAESMRLAWQDRRAYLSAEEHIPQRSDVVFLDTDSDGQSDSVAIVTSVFETGLTVIMGDSNDRVETVKLELSDGIVGYGLTSELSFAEDTEADGRDTEGALVEQTYEFEAEPLVLYSSGASSITYTSELESQLTGAVFKTEDGTVIDSGDTVYVGQKYIVSLEFSEINTGSQWVQLRHNSDGYLTYQIPSNLQCDEFTSWHSISAVTENGAVQDVGEYFVTEDGLLMVRFFEDESGVNFLDKYANVAFSIEFNTTLAATQSGTYTEVAFNDEIKVELEVDGGAGIEVTKTHGTYDATEHTMEYTVTVEATNGVVSGLVLSDEIWVNHYTLRETITVTDLDGEPLDPQPTVSDHPYHEDGAEEGFTLSGFPDFSAGEGFIITYKTQVYDEELTEETVDLWNGVYAEGQDSNGDTVDKYTEDWLRVELEKMEKDGGQVVVEDDNGNSVSVIEWEVEIKKSNSDLQGTVVIDTLGDGLSYFTDKRIRIKCYDESGNRLEDVYLSWDQVTVDGNTMSLTLPEGFAFEIIYYTTYEELAESEYKQYTNSVSAVINGTQESTSGSADVVGFVPEVSKSVQGTDGEYAYFTIEAKVPAVIKDWGHFYLNDLSAFWSYNDDGDHRYVENLPEELSVTAVTESGETVTFTPYVEGGATENTYILEAPADEDLYHSFYIYFNTSEASADSSKWILSEDATLYVTYKLSFDMRTGASWGGEVTDEITLGDMLLDGHGMANEAYLNYTEVIGGIGVAVYEYSPTVTKESVVNKDGTIDYTVVFHNTVPGSYGDLGYINADTASVYFNDTFDPRLEYVQGSLAVTCYDPWRDGLWLNKYAYSGEVTGNSMRVPASDFAFTEYNQAAVDVGWGSLYKRTDLEKYYKYVNAGGDYVFTYTLKVRDEYFHTTDTNLLVFDNTAEITWDTEGSSGPIDHSSEFETGLIDKAVVQNETRLDFSIHINRNALDILEGTETLTIEDTMTANLSIYWDTIKFYYEDAEGNMIDFDSEESQYTYTVTYDHVNNMLIFIVPDGLHVMIDYTTLITESGLVSVNNVVKIDGKAQVSDFVDAVFNVEDHSGDASGSVHSITLIKQDGDTKLPLPDTTFYLYGPVGDPDAAVPDSAQATLVTDDGVTLQYIGSYTTGADGTVLIETQYLTHGGPYALMEAEAPPGYNGLEKPVYFYFYETDPDGMIQTVTTIVAVENYTYNFVFPETGGIGAVPLTIIGLALAALPILYTKFRRRREGGKE